MGRCIIRGARRGTHPLILDRRCDCASTRSTGGGRQGSIAAIRTGELADPGIPNHVGIDGCRVLPGRKPRVLARPEFSYDEQPRRDGNHDLRPWDHDLAPGSRRRVALRRGYLECRAGRLAPLGSSARPCELRDRRLSINGNKSRGSGSNQSRADTGQRSASDGSIRCQPESSRKDREPGPEQACTRLRQRKVGCTVPSQTTPTITRRTGVLYTACSSQAPEPQKAALTRRSSSTFTSHGSLKLPPLVRDGFEPQDEDMRTILLPFHSEDSFRSG